jgi:hypothetical protein
VRWSEKEVVASQIVRLENEKCDCSSELTAGENHIEALALEIAQKEARRRELDLACAQSSVFQEEEKLRSRKQVLLDEQKNLLQELNKLALDI